MKTCLICAHESPPPTPTCPRCGEATWSEKRADTRRTPARTLPSPPTVSESNPSDEGEADAVEHARTKPEQAGEAEPERTKRRARRSKKGRS